MGIMQKGLETYNAMEKLAGRPVEGRQTLAPVGHMIANATIEITINAAGDFESVKAVDLKAVIPCTEDSASRTSGVAPHPLCDQVGYISGSNKKKYDAYIEGLEGWIKFGCTNPKLLAIMSYVKKKSLLNDINNEKISEKDMVVWRVINLGAESGLVCEDYDLQEEYIKYYLNRLSNDNSRKADYCMVAGKQLITTSRHLKGVVSNAGNAKIISSNDTRNYTYRGILLDENEACSVGYLSSQKAHNALKWVVANEGVYLGNRICVCWNPSGNTIPKIDMPIVIGGDETPTPTAYKEVLQKKLLGYKTGLPDGESVVIAMLEAATNGRLSITYYNELACSDFLDRLAAWDYVTCFPSSFYGVYSPKLSDIINMSYGTYRGEYFDTDGRIYSQHMQRIIICRVNNGRIPQDIVKRLVENASRLFLYNNATRDRMLHVTCSVIKKRHMDVYKEEWPMALEREKKDRSYQYGRLLAVMEKMERDTYDSGENKRETNAIRSQHMFIQRPQTGFACIMEKLQQSYIRKLPEGAKVYYDKLIQEIVNVISECDGEANAPLTESYLMGYYLQKQAFYIKKDSATSVNKDE